MDESLRRISPYAWSLAIVIAAALIRAGLAPLLGDHYPLGTFYAAVAVIGWFWGVAPAVLAAVCGYFVGAHFFLIPHAAPFWARPQTLEVVVYALICTALIALVYRVFERQSRLDHAIAAHAATQRALADTVKHSEQRYRSVGEAFDFGVWSANPDGAPSFASPRFLEFLGTTLEHAEARMWSAVQAPAAEIRDAAARWDSCRTRGEPWEWEYSLRGAGGGVRRLWSRRIPLRAADGAVASWAGFNLDVTDRYTAAHARDEARSRLEAVTNAMTVGVAQCNRHLEYVWVNPAYARMVGLSAQDTDVVHGRSVESVLGADAFSQLQPSVRRVLGGQSADYEGTLRSGLEPNRWVRATMTPIWEGETEPIGWVMVVSDLTERRELEEQLRTTNRRKDEFLATLAHELRNPLAPIRYATQLLKPGTPSEMSADARRMIDRQLAHMAQLLDDLLEVSRITRGTLKIRSDAVDLRSVVRHAASAARPLAESVEQSLQVELPDQPLPVRGDETRLVQVIGNLINNAIKFTNAGGNIHVSAALENAHVAVRVRDSGRGISRELLPRLFEMFTQGERNAGAQTGLGIGLALARQMVELHGGRIEAHSDGPHKGAEFCVFLPRVAEVPAIAEPARDAAKVAVLGADNISVLIVDDNVDAADALAQFLKLAGYRTRVAYDGRTALEMAEILEPAVVLLDLGLPHLSGHEVARRVRSMRWGRSARLIALTGWGQEDDVQRSRQAGFDDHFTKPVDPDLLLQRIMHLTRGEPQTAQTAGSPGDGSAH